MMKSKKNQLHSDCFHSPKHPVEDDLLSINIQDTAKTSAMGSNIMGRLEKLK